jgi:hypothetical protein
MTGRPLNSDLQLARELGLLTYTGSAHARCGTTERYVKGGGCVHCARIIATEQREARKYLQSIKDEQKDPVDKPKPMAHLPEDDAEIRRQAAIDDLM